MEHHLKIQKDEILQETKSIQLFDGDYTLLVERYQTYIWAKIRDQSDELVASIQLEEHFFYYSEVGRYYLIVGRQRALVDLKMRTWRQLDQAVLIWNHVLLSPDERTLLVMGEHCMDQRVYAFYNLVDPQLKQLDTPDLEIHISLDEDYEDETGQPSLCAFAETKAEWQSDGRLVWTEERPYYTGLRMWHSEAESHFELLISEDSKSSAGDYITQRYEAMDKEKREWRVFKRTILVRQGNKMVEV